LILEEEKRIKFSWGKKQQQILLIWLATVPEFRGGFGLPCQLPLHKPGPKVACGADTDL
jgi:hypothetical protein